jgi:prolyl-tRNA synthetase
VARRDTKEKATQPLAGIAAHVKDLLDDIQQNLFNRAAAYRAQKTTRVDTFEAFEAIMATDEPGFVSAHWDGTTETELKIKELTKATIRCIPLDNELEDGQCILTGRPSTQRVLFAKAY